MARRRERRVAPSAWSERTAGIRLQITKRMLKIWVHGMIIRAAANPKSINLTACSRCRPAGGTGGGVHRVRRGVGGVWVVMGVVSLDAVSDSDGECAVETDSCFVENAIGSNLSVFQFQGSVWRIGKFGLFDIVRLCRKGPLCRKTRPVEKWSAAKTEPCVCEGLFDGYSATSLELAQHDAHHKQSSPPHKHEEHGQNQPYFRRLVHGRGQRFRFMGGRSGRNRLGGRCFLGIVNG